jgi:glycosyltransferase EpsE
MKPRISVLMGIYNCEETLPEALDSLYNQTYKDFKLILCDDASTDETYQVAKSYAAKYNNIILIENKNNIKLGATLNHCLEYADTDYVARMDGDDISLPTRFEKEIEFLDNNHEYAVVSCPMTYFDESGNWGVGNPNEKPTKDDFKKNTPFAHGPCMIRTNVMKEVNGYTVNKFLIRGQDYYLWYKIYMAGYKGYNIKESLYKMRDDKDAMARRTFRTRYNGFIVKKYVIRDLGIPNAFYYALPTLIKAFIPFFIMKKIRQKKISFRAK